MSTSSFESQQEIVGSFVSGDEKTSQLGTVRLTEIFFSLQGEGRFTGLPTVFVRLTGCPLRCNYCDTEYAFHGGEVHHIADVLDQVAAYGAKHVCVTGGEPLAQRKACLTLCESLSDRGMSVSIETSGAMPVEGVDPRVCIVLDLKTPSSGECHRNLYENVPLLRVEDQVKFVIADRDDYNWCCSQLIQHDLVTRGVEILFSPSNDVLAPRTLAQWIIEDKLEVRMQLQMHKYIWGDETGR